MKEFEPQFLICQPKGENHGVFLLAWYISVSRALANAHFRNSSLEQNNVEREITKFASEQKRLILKEFEPSGLDIRSFRNITLPRLSWIYAPTLVVKFSLVEEAAIFKLKYLKHVVTSITNDTLATCPKLGVSSY